MKIFKFVGLTPEPLNLKQPKMQVILQPGKSYKLPEDNKIVWRLIDRNLLQDLGEVKIKKKHRASKAPKKTPSLDTEKSITDS